MRESAIWTAGLTAAVILASGCPAFDKKAVPNQPPVAAVTSSPGTQVAPGVRVTLDASASADPEGRALTFLWRQEAGTPIAGVDGATDAVIGFEVPPVRQSLVFSLTVNDGRQDGEPAYARVDVDFNTAPVADPGLGVEVRNGAQVLLSGRGADADGDGIVAYAWVVEGGPAPAAGLDASWEIAGTDGPSPLFRPRMKGLYALSLVVTDARGTASLAAPLVVRSLDNPPSIAVGDAQSTVNHSPATLTATPDEPDPGDEATCRWSLVAAPAGSALPGLAGVETTALTVTPHTKGTYVFEVGCTDGELSAEPKQVVLVATNNLPSADAQPQAVDNGGTLVLAATGADPDGDAVSLGWAMADAGGKPYELGLNEAGLATFTPKAKGAYTLQVTPHDGEAAGQARTVPVTSRNRPPVAVAAASKGALSTGEELTLSGDSSHDPDGLPSGTALAYRWRIVQGSATFAAAGEELKASPKVKAGAIKESLAFELVVTDEEQAASAPATVTVAVDNTAPIGVADGDAFADAGGQGALDASLSYDLETPAGQLAYEWTCLTDPSIALHPSGAVEQPTFDAPEAPGTALTFQLRVFDGRLWSAPSTVEVVVAPSEAKSVFVDAAATCGAACDGTRAAPFRTLPPAVAAGSGLSPPKDVYLRPGTYRGAVTLPASMSVTGGCDARWLCDGSAGEALVVGGAAEATTVSILARDVAPNRLSHLTVRSTDGAGLPDGSGVTALYCNGCQAEFDDVAVVADGTAAAVWYTTALALEATTGPVRFDRGRIEGGAGYHNVALSLNGSSGFHVTGSTLQSRDTIKPPPSKIPGGELWNMVVDFNFSGSDLVFERNRIVAQGDALAGICFGLRLWATSTVGAVFAGNLFWSRQRCSGAGGWPDVANATVLFYGNGTASFVNNTFVGNAAGVQADKGFSTFAFKYTSSNNHWPQIAAYATNNYFQDYRHLVWANFEWSTHIKLVSNSAHGITCYSNGGGACQTSVAVLDSSSNPISPGGSGNAEEDCKLADAFNGDWHVAADSPCRGTGALDVLAPATDLDGDARPDPAGSAIDRGADEAP